MSWFSTFRNDKKIVGASYDANFYFYFGKNDKASAKKAEKELAAKGFETDLHWLDYEEGQWSLTLNKQVTGLDEIAQLEDALLEETAKKYGGTYDGHEIAV